MFGMGTGGTPPVWPPGILEKVEAKVQVKGFENFRKSTLTSALTLAFSNQDHVYQEQSYVKPHGRLVLVSFRPLSPSTPSLSNLWSTSGL